jgi:tRNA wybutosine-synthesizing protein 1
MLPSFSCPTAIRMTLVRNLNLRNVEGYSKILEKISPTYVEPKSYMYVGYSRRRLAFESMPSHGDILDFSKQLATQMSYKIVDESRESRVVLLTRLEKPMKVV